MSRQNCLGGAAKTMTTGASACNPTDFVSVAGTVRVPQDLIGGKKLSFRDLRMRLENCPGCKRQLFKPSVLAFRLNVKTVN